MLYEDIVKGSIFIYYELLFTNTITNEKFVKIGVTTTSITCRYTSQQYSDYTYEVLTELYTTNELYIKIESIYKRINAEYCYGNNLTNWTGYTETFYINENLKIMNYNNVALLHTKLLITDIIKS
jgi:hypothetical protein